MNAAASPRPPKLDGAEDTVKDFWASRPRRPRRGRKFAGVAAGIGNRYGLDPVLVRVAFIVATIMGGFGVLLYLLGWLFLPDERDAVSPVEALLGKGHSSMSTPLTIVLCVALFPASGWAFGGMWSGSGSLLMLALVVGGLFLLHRSRGHQNRPPEVRQDRTWAAAPAEFHAQEPPEAGASAAPVDTDAATAEEPAISEAVGQGGWDPLGAEPMAWDLPEAPAISAETLEVTPRAPKRRSKAGPLVLGLALLTAAAATALNLLGVAWFSPAHIIGLTLGVVGLGLVASAFTGGSRGLVLLALPLAAAGILLTAMPMQNLPGGGMGEINANPRSAGEVAEVYERTMGSVSLDLTGIGESKPIETTVRAGMGEAKVIVPPDADVTFECSSSMGNVECLGKSAQGMHMNGMDVRGTDYGDDGEGGQQITLNVSSRMGSVEVARG